LSPWFAVFSFVEGRKMADKLSRQEWAEKQREKRLAALASEAGLRPDVPAKVLADRLEEGGQDELAREVRERLDPDVPQAVLSTKKTYQVGRRHVYVYYLVKDCRSPEDQRRSARYWGARFLLTAEERRGLADLLNHLNRRFGPYWQGEAYTALRSRPPCTFTTSSRTAGPRRISGGPPGTGVPASS
jgi:hypothetical protein